MEMEELLEQRAKELNIRDNVAKTYLDGEINPKHNQNSAMTTKFDKGQQSVELMARLMLLPEINLKDYQQVDQRILDYLAIEHSIGGQPKVTALAAALGISRQDLYRIVRGIGLSVTKQPPESVVRLIKKVYQLIEVTHENNMLNGAVNTVIAIFLSKVHFGMNDQISTFVDNPDGFEGGYSVEDIKQKYLREKDLE